MHQATVESKHASRLEVYKKEWFMCTWKVTNTGGLDFSSRTSLVKVRTCSLNRVLFLLIIGVAADFLACNRPWHGI